MSKNKIKKFVEEFTKTHSKLINRVCNKYRIPNRYSNEDMAQYIALKIQEILEARRGKENKIEDPEKYFKSCLDYYCIEYQRMNGHIFNLPNRPRKNCEEDETEARSKGFKYIGDITIQEENNLYVEENFEFDNHYLGYSSKAWSTLTGLVPKEEADVIDCIYEKNLNWCQTSEYLKVPQSTCWFRHLRALKKIKEKINDLSQEDKFFIVNLLRNKDGE